MRQGLMLLRVFDQAYCQEMSEDGSHYSHDAKA